MDFILNKLPDEPSTAHADARMFCLSVIKEFYNIDYNPLWHADLDSLVLSPGENWYSSVSRGSFWVYQNNAGEIVGTCGIYNMIHKPTTSERLSSHYDDIENVCQLSRMYIRKNLRGHGLGSKLDVLATTEALRVGYKNIYLHADATAEATLMFWESRRYARIDEDKNFQVIDFNKKIGQ